MKRIQMLFIIAGFSVGLVANDSSLDSKKTTNKVVNNSTESVLNSVESFFSEKIEDVSDHFSDQSSHDEVSTLYVDEINSLGKTIYNNIASFYPNSSVVDTVEPVKEVTDLDIPVESHDVEVGKDTIFEVLEQIVQDDTYSSTTDVESVQTIEIVIPVEVAPVSQDAGVDTDTILTVIDPVQENTTELNIGETQVADEFIDNVGTEAITRVAIDLNIPVEAQDVEIGNDTISEALEQIVQDATSSSTTDVEAVQAIEIAIPVEVAPVSQDTGVDADTILAVVEPVQENITLDIPVEDQGVESGKDTISEALEQIVQDAISSSTTDVKAVQAIEIEIPVEVAPVNQDAGVDTDTILTVIDPVQENTTELNIGETQVADEFIDNVGTEAITRVAIDLNIPVESHDVEVGKDTISESLERMVKDVTVLDANKWKDIFNRVFMLDFTDQSDGVDIEIVDEVLDIRLNVSNKSRADIYKSIDGSRKSVVGSFHDFVVKVKSDFYKNLRESVTQSNDEPQQDNVSDLKTDNAEIVPLDESLIVDNRQEDNVDNLKIDDAESVPLNEPSIVENLHQDDAGNVRLNEPSIIENSHQDDTTKNLMVNVSNYVQTNLGITSVITTATVLVVGMASFYMYKQYNDEAQGADVENS